jgi:hypothetical protein
MYFNITIQMQFENIWNWFLNYCASTSFLPISLSQNLKQDRYFICTWIAKLEVFHTYRNQLSVISFSNSTMLDHVLSFHISLPTSELTLLTQIPLWHLVREKCYNNNEHYIWIQGPFTFFLYLLSLTKYTCSI